MFSKKIKKNLISFWEKNFDHEYIFEKYCEHLLNLVKNLINCQFHHAQLFIDAKQEKKQSMQIFEIYLSDFENQLISYNEIQRVIYLFIKLKSKLRAILINYQNLSIIKKRLLILTCWLKNNMKKTIDA